MVEMIALKAKLLLLDPNLGSIVLRTVIVAVVPDLRLFDQFHQSLIVK